MTTNSITYDFSYGERVQYSVLPARDVEKTEEKPGIYAWYARLGKAVQDQAQPGWTFAQFFLNRELIVEAKGSLREAYRGRIFRQTDADFRDRNDLIEGATTVFCPPIYIGISKNIRNRLTTHVRKLREVLASAPEAAGNSAESVKAGVQTDTDEESSVFGSRIGAKLHDAGLRSEEILFVKVMYVERSASSQLRDTEYLLNRSFFPVFGKR